MYALCMGHGCKDRKLSISEDHPIIGVCIQALRRGRENKSDAVQSAAPVDLLIRVETYVEHFILFSPPTEASYVDLKVAIDSYRGSAQRKQFIETN